MLKCFLYRKKFGLAAKLESVLKQHRSDMALQEHLVGGGQEVEELYLTVAEVVRRDAFMTELRGDIQCCREIRLGDVMIQVIPLNGTQGNWFNLDIFSRCCHSRFTILTVKLTG